MKNPSTNFARQLLAKRFGDGAIRCADTPRVLTHDGMAYSTTRFAMVIHALTKSGLHLPHLAKLVRGYLFVAAQNCVTATP